MNVKFVNLSFLRRKTCNRTKPTSQPTYMKINLDDFFGNLQDNKSHLPSVLETTGFTRVVGFE